MTVSTEERSEAVAARGARLSKALLANVVLLTMIAPLATDMYVPAFPIVGDDLQSSATEVQLTLTTFFVGMALGQLVGGPVSDQRGRRRPLLGALVVMSLASVVCALSPSIGVMMIARLVQGFSGGWAMVIARSLVVDLASGARLVKSLNLVQGVAGVAPIVGPLLGAAILQLSHWRVSFWLLAVWSAVMLLTVALAVPETLPVERRHGGGLRHLRAAASRVLRSRGFVGYLVVMAFSMGVTFAYVATSAFVLQSMNGLSPVVYSIDFAANAVGLTIATLVAARLAGRIPTRVVIAVGLAATAVGGHAAPGRRAVVRHAAGGRGGRLLRAHDRPRPDRPQRRRARLRGGARPPRHRVRGARVPAVVHRRSDRPDRRPRW